MKIDNRLHMARIGATGLLITLVLTAGPVFADASAGAPPEQVAKSIRTSSFSPEEQERIIGKSGEAISAGIPAPDVEIIIDRGIRGKVDARTLEALLDAALTVRQKNLPVRPVLDRIQQGLSKGVPPERILIASDRLSEKLSAARPVLQAALDQGLTSTGPAEQDRTLETLARALEKGIPEQNISRISGIVKERSGPLALFERSVDTMTGFSENGMPVETAVRLIDRALTKGYREQDFARMERDLADQVAQGRPVPDIVSGMESHISKSRSGQGYGAPDSSEMRGPAGGRGGVGGIGGRMDRRR